MFQYKQITDVLGRQILDGRGLPALEVEILSEDGETGRLAVSLNASEERMEELAESLELLINTEIADMLIGENLLAQSHVDQILERIAGVVGEGAARKSAVRAVSCVTARTAAESLGIPLYQYLGGVQVQSIPLVRICIPEEKQPGAQCRIRMEKWKEYYKHTEISSEGREDRMEKRMRSDEYVTVTQCLKQIHTWKKQKTEPVVMKDMEYAVDAFLVDLAVAAGVDVLELRPPVRGENTVKYTQLMRILEHL